MGKRNRNNHRSNLKVRNLVKKKLPCGIYRYLVIFNLHFFNIRSKKYNLPKSYDRLVPLKTRRERNEVRYFYQTEISRRERIVSLDKLMDDLEHFSVGKTRVNFRWPRSKPLYVYLSDEIDLTILLMNYQQDIFRIYKISTTAELEEN